MKNEINVIKRCLNSLVKYVDSWVIVDTGSKDGTQEAVIQTLRSVPGRLYERPWVDFATNRNEALSLAKGEGDFALFIDADEVFFPDPSFSWPLLDHDCYFATFLLENGSQIQRLFLANLHQRWVWKGALHEELTTDEPRRGQVLEGAKIRVIQDGRRSLDPKKYLKDATLLEKELQKNPLCARSAFYLALSYDMAREEILALNAFQKRSQMEGWDEETYYAYYRLGCLEEKLGREPIHSFCKAFETRVQRAEPLYRLAQRCNRKQAPFLAYLLVQFARTLSFPKDRTFVEQDVYDYQLLIELANAATLLGEKSLALRSMEEILTKKTLPLTTREQVERIKKILLT